MKVTILRLSKRPIKFVAIMKTAYVLTSFIFCFLTCFSTSYSTSLEGLHSNSPSSSRAFEENNGQILGEDTDKVLYVHKTERMSMLLMQTGIMYPLHDYKNNQEDAEKTNNFSFQQGHTVETDFILNSDAVSFQIADYVSSQTLVIDPEIEWGTYYGGSGTEGLLSVTTDDLGNVYACGTTYGSDSLASGGFQNFNPTLNGGSAAAFLVKFNSEGDRLWATYYSGGGFTGAISVAVDSEQNVYMTGLTQDQSLAFNGFQNLKSGSSDAYLVKFNSAGERLWATYLGGSNDDVSRTVAIDNQDNVYITGITFSPDFPILNGYQEFPGANIGSFGDAFLSKFDPSGNLLWSTYYGGSQGEFAFFVTCDKSDNVIITGRTTSSSDIFLDGHQSQYGGNTDAFVAKYNAAGNMQWSSYYGGSGQDIAYGCATDKLGNIIITGETGSLNNISFNGFQNTYAAAFLAKFNASGDREWGTYYGTGSAGPGSGANVGYACAVDSENNVFMSGGTNSFMGISSEGFQNNYGGGSSDAYLVKFGPSGDRSWGTYLGGSQNDYARAMHIDETSTIYLAGTTQSSNNIFINGFQGTQENETGFVSKIITCPNPTLVSVPEELCAGSSLVLDPFPVGGNLELIGEGELNQSTFIAPDVSENTVVTLRYSISANGTCPSVVNDFQLTIVPNEIGTASLTTMTDVICENDNVSIQANIENVGSTPTIKWYLNNQLVQEDGLTFTSSTLVNNDAVQVEIQSSNTCATPNLIVSNSIEFTVSPIPVVGLVFTELQGGTLVSDLGFSSYEWYFEGEVIPGANSSTLTPIENGTYTVIVTNEFGCAGTASTTVLTVGLAEEISESFSIYPNPTDGLLNIKFGTRAPEKYTIYNTIGKQVHIKIDPSTNELLDLRFLSPGIYIMSFNIEGNVTVKRIVIQ